MKLSIWVFLISLLTSISAYSAPGAYERLWYYYAYTLDTAGNKVAAGCASPPKRCTFQQFLNYIDQNPKALTPLTGNIDPTNVDDTVQKLIAGDYTGPYRPELIYKGVARNSGVQPLFKAITGFLGGVTADADDATKNALQMTTKAVTALRQSASIPAVTDFLKAKGVTLVTRQYQFNPGQFSTAVDIPGTVAANPATKPRVFGEHLQEWAASDTGHSGNIEAAKEGMAVVSDACGA